MNVDTLKTRDINFGFRKLFIEGLSRINLGEYPSIFLWRCEKGKMYYTYIYPASDNNESIFETNLQREEAAIREQHLKDCIEKHPLIRDQFELVSFQSINIQDAADHMIEHITNKMGI